MAAEPPLSLSSLWGDLCAALDATFFSRVHGMDVYVIGLRSRYGSLLHIGSAKRTACARPYLSMMRVFMPDGRPPPPLGVPILLYRDDDDDEQATPFELPQDHAVPHDFHSKRELLLAVLSLVTPEMVAALEPTSDIHANEPDKPPEADPQPAENNA